jgi:hypothetical protein
MISSAFQRAVQIGFHQVLTCIAKRLIDLTFKRICYALTNYLYVSLCDRILHLGTIQIILEIFYCLYSEALVRQRTIPTERPPLVGEVSDNFRVVTATNSHGR